MGLDTTHDCWHGGYGSFFAFRKAIAKAAGWPTSDDGFDYALPSNRTWAQVVADMNNDPNVLGHWTTKPTDPLEFLLCHQDCDGAIEHEDQAPLIGALEPLVDKIAPEWRERLEQFIKGLRAANEAGENVEFH